jgi:glyoxylase-like metal-dependent hydrolase (beta-lactamase superfamily II)
MVPFQVTGTIQRECWHARELPPIEQVRPRTWSVPIDFGHSPVRYTFCYILLDDDGTAIVLDPGWDSELGRSQMTAGLAAAGLDLADVAGVVSTHFHPDHLGMVAWLSAASGAWVGMSAAEARQLVQYEDTAAARQRDRIWIETIGGPLELAISADAVRHTAGLARPTLILEDGGLLPMHGRHLRAILTPGHTVGHLCFVDEDDEVLFSGDHVLPRITPNVGMTATGSRTHALSRYYDSLARMAEWDDFEVLPAHEYRFRGLQARAEQLADHHRQRSEEIRVLVEGSPSIDVYTIASRIHWAREWRSFDGINLRAALGETEAHVDHLVETGRLEVWPPESAPRLHRVPGRRVASD